MKIKIFKNTNGFTLIELLVVVAIIGLLSSIVLSSLNTARTKGKYARAKLDMEQLRILAEVAKGERGKTFGEITGSLCTECACRQPGLMTNNIHLLPKTDQCWIAEQNVITLLNNATGGTITFNGSVADPWGGPYLFNENEGEGGCYTDNIASAGPDGFYYNSDDIVVNLPPIKCVVDIGPHHPNVNW